MKSKGRVLVIDDEPDIAELLSITLQRMGVDCDVALTFEQGIHAILSHEYFLVLTDMRLPDGDGLGIVSYIQSHKPQTPVAVITAFGSVESAVTTLKAGAFDYVSKPIDLSILQALVETALTMKHRPMEQHSMLLGKSKAMVQLRGQIDKLARSQAPVFIHGESGVGKELVARLIHAASPRSDKSFIAVNCAAIPSELMESEFFGHKKGSFTGAFADKKGLFEAALGGTLFLDEIAELPLAMQVKLFRAIQEKAIKPVGATTELPVDVRILSASNKNLKQEVALGHFRQELYYRINVIELKVPSLKERITDIPVLVKAILKKLAEVHGVKPMTISEEAMNALKAYHFPGNVRELENILERSMTLCNGEIITAHDLTLEYFEPKQEEAHQVKLLGDTLQDREKELIMEALNQTKWNRTKAAKLLGLSFRTLRYRIKKLGLDEER